MPKVIPVTVYEIHELSDEAQAHAHSEYLNDAQEYFIDEEIQRVKDFLKHCGNELTDYSLSPYSYSYMNTTIENETIRNLSPKDVLTFEEEMWIDGVMIKAFKKHLEMFPGDVRNALIGAVDVATNSIVGQMEYQDSLEYFIEACEANDYTFRKNGEMF